VIIIIFLEVLIVLGFQYQYG